MINKKKLFKCLIIIALIIIIIVSVILLRRTLAKYETEATTERDVDVAFWAVDNSFEEQRLLIEDIYPTTETFDYTFTVSNFDPGSLPTDADDQIAETDIEYELVIITTTNLPLSYEIQRNGTTYSDVQEEIYADTDGTYYRKLKIGTTANPYPLKLDTITDTDGDGEFSKGKVTDTYKLKVTFPIQSYVNGTLVNNRANLEYADLIEDVKIELSARQVIGE